MSAPLNLQLLPFAFSRGRGLALLLLCGCEVIHGSGNVISEKRNVDEFDSIVLEGEGDVRFSQSDRHRLVIEAEDNLVGELITDTRGDKLIIRTRDSVFLDPTKAIVFHIDAPGLSSVKVEGVATFDAVELDTDHFNLEISGSGRLTIGKLMADSVSADISGSGDVRLAGEVSAQDVEISGSGEYRCRNLKSEDARIDVSGSGAVEVYATQTLDVDISGSGDVAVRGKPDTSVDISGSGDLSSLN